jgi:hypothetical protein
MKCLLLTLTLLLLLFSTDARAQSESSTGKIFWRGTVDNKVHLVVRGDSLEQRTVEGASKEPGKFSFTAPLPDEAVTVGVNRKEGRSKKIKVIQQPTAENDFTAIIEIHDDGSGARDYQLEIFWR